MLGTSVLTATFRYNPAVIAQAFATMACLYPDRIVLGLGTGEALNETAVTGAEWPDFKGRFARLREAVRLMRQLWTEDQVSFDGRVLPDRRRHGVRQARASGAGVHRRGRPGGGEVRGPGR